MKFDSVYEMSRQFMKKASRFDDGEDEYWDELDRQFEQKIKQPIEFYDKDSDSETKDEFLFKLHEWKRDVIGSKPSYDKLISLKEKLELEAQSLLNNGSAVPKMLEAKLNEINHIVANGPNNSFKKSLR